MRRPEKILLFFGALTALFYSATTVLLFYPVLPITDFIQNAQLRYPVLNMILAIFGALLCVCFLALMLLAIFFPKRSDTLTFFKEKSRLQFSKRAVESTVRYSFQDLPGINFTKINVKIHRQPEKTRVFVKLSTENSGQLLNLSETIKEKIEAELQSSLGLTVQSVDIKVTGVNTEYKKQHPEQESAPEQTRVV